MQKTAGITEQADTFVDANEVIFEGLSNSLKAKYRQAQKVITTRAAELKRGDPVLLSGDSSRFVVDLLLNFSGMADAITAESIKKEDTVNGIITGMRWVYTREGHTAAWMVQTTSNVTRPFQETR